jgi:hypothetical protein
MVLMSVAMAGVAATRGFFEFCFKTKTIFGHDCFTGSQA